MKYASKCILHYFIFLLAFFKYFFFLHDTNFNYENYIKTNAFFIYIKCWLIIVKLITSVLCFIQAFYGEPLLISIGLRLLSSTRKPYHDHQRKGHNFINVNPFHVQYNEKEITYRSSLNKMSRKC